MKKSNKGFTLVEIIMVVAIIAVLMAVSVPSILQYVDDADDAKYYAQARSVLTTLQTEAAKYKINDELTDTVLYDHRDEIIDIANVTGHLVSVTPSETGNLIEEFIYKIDDNGSKAVQYVQDPGKMSIITYYETLGETELLNKMTSIAAKDTIYVNLDSAAASLAPNSVAGKIAAKMKEAGIDLESMGIKTWRIGIGANKMRYIIWSEEDISTKSSGDKVTVMRYNLTGEYQGLYSVWTADVQETSVKEYSGTYNALAITLDEKEYSASLSKEDKTNYSTVYENYLENK